KFEEASGGTLFLDEISAMPLGVQSKLLRALQERDIARLGESAPRKVDVRIIAATNRDLQTMVADGAFREDLYYPLAVVPVVLPPPRQRSEDIPVLVEHFLQQACERHGRPPVRIAREVFAAFNAYAWPGNVRELKNTIERMVVLARGDVLTLDDLPDQIKNTLRGASNV